MNLELGFFTTADGETGSWTGNSNVCALDQPAFVTLPMCCNELEEGFDMLDPICSEQPFVYVIDEPGVEYWTWTVESQGVNGAFPGEGGPGSTIIHVLTNTSGDPEIVTYTFLGFAGGACPVFIKEVEIEVFPEIDVDLDSEPMCSTPDEPYELTPTVTGGTGAYEYSWSPFGETTPTVMVNNPVNGTTYIVSVTDNAGCFSTASVTISVYTTFPVDIDAPIVEQCAELGPISLGGDATGGYPPYSWEWSFPGGTMSSAQDINTTESGEHLLIVTDDHGCIGKDSVVITLNPTPEVYIDAVGGILALCEGQSTQLTGVASMGQSPYYYEWDTPDGPFSGKTITAYTPGIYTVTVEDANGCSNEYELAIEAQEEPMPDLGPDVLVCNFSEAVVLAVNQSYDDYEWSIGSSGDGQQEIEVFNEGSYEVTVTNEFGCQGEDEIDVGLYPVTPFPLPDTIEICPGNLLIVNADDYGGPWVGYEWSSGNSTNEFVTNAGGNFSVSLIDINGCEVYKDFVVSETASVTVGLNGDNVICSGESTTLSTVGGFAQYEWSSGPTTSFINVNTPGWYYVTVEDTDGCEGVDSLEVVSGDFTATINGPTEICANVQATITALPNFGTYVWGHGPTSQSVMVEEGSWTVTVTNVDGCVSSTSINIIETPFLPQITGDNMICQTNETSVLDAGGPYVSYMWSPNTGGATTQTVSVNTAGIYNVTVVDVSGCVGNASFTVSNHPVPFVNIAGLLDFCVGGNTQLSATAGFPNYVWNTTETNPSITVNTAGPYTVTITDANGCTNTAMTTVNPPYQETVDISGSATFCPGDQATIEVDPSYVSIMWSTGQTANQISVSTPGQITVIVVDADGCIAYDTIDITEDAILSPNITGNGVICDAGPGSLNAGPNFDTYFWSHGLGSTQIVMVTAPGTYTVTVTDGNCSGTDDFVVNQNTTPSATVTATSSACNIQEPGGPTTIINFSGLVTGGDTGGNWAQTGGPGSVNISNPANVNFNGLTPGVYTFTYTTATAVAPCMNVSYPVTITINDCACPVVSLHNPPDLCNDMGTIALNTLLAGGTQLGGTWTIVSSPPGSNPIIIGPGPTLEAGDADPGTYTIQYQVNGLPVYCPDDATVNVNVLPNPDAGVAAPPVQFCMGESQTVDLASMLIGADPGGMWIETSQNMSTGGAFNPATGRFNVVAQAPGTYTFSYVIPGPGPCPDDMTTVEVIVEANPVADAGATATLDCDMSTTQLGGSGTSTGQDFSYLWTTSDGVVSDSTQLNAIASAKGTYVLLVTNTKTGCTATDEVFIDQIGEFPSDMNLNVHSPDCEGDPPGSAVVNGIVGGTPPYSYVLNNGQPVSNANFQNLPAGNYTLEVTDASGCKLSESFVIEELVEVDLEIVNYSNDTFVYALGDSVRFSYLYSGSSDTPDSLVWKMGDSIICINCAFIEFEAYLSGQITLEAYDIRGCFISKYVTFLVVRKRDVYIPNIFSPNGDNLNDFFTMFTDSDVKEITVLEVYTRWGDLVFRKTNFQPNDPSAGWDGTFRGEQLNPGVYVYRMEIIYGDDLRDNLAGDITIIR
jgi:gliding motility-associated-like protein